MIDQFKELYVHDCINGDGMSDELNQLFEKLLLEEFNDDHTKMDELIQSIIDENTPKEPSELELLQQENAELKERQEMAEEALLSLSDMLLNR